VPGAETFLGIDSDGGATSPPNGGAADNGDAPLIAGATEGPGSVTGEDAGLGAIVAVPPGGFAPLALTLEVASKDGSAGAYRWDLGNGDVVAGGATLEYTYEIPGIYTVEAVAPDGAEGEVVHDVAIPVVSQITIDIEAGDDPLTFTFAAVTAEPDQQLPAGTYRWEFSDGGIEYGTTLTRTFRSFDPVYVALTVTIAGVEIGCGHANVQMHAQPLVANAGPDRVIVYSDDDGVENVTLDASGSEGSIEAYLWREGDTVLAATTDVSVVVPLHVGEYVIALEVFGGELTASDEVRITEWPCPADCETSTSSWQNFTTDAYSGASVAEFDVVPHAAHIDALTGLSEGPGSGYADFAVLVRFNDAGTIDVRDGGTYRADAVMPYTAGQTYHVRLEVDCAAKRYDVYVTPPGGAEQQIADDYAFRTDRMTSPV